MLRAKRSSHGKLQAAGFDVSGAPDLDGDMLRRAFRDFIAQLLAPPEPSAEVRFLVLLVR
jgi:hypothetical protein